MAYQDIEFLLISNENYLDVDFVMYVPEYEDISFYLQSNLDYYDSDFYFDFHIISYVEFFFLMPGNFQSYRDRVFQFIAVDQDFLDVEFLNYVPEYLNVEFNATLAEYEEKNFLTYVPDHEDVNFLNYVPDHYDVTLFIPTPGYLDINTLIELGENVDVDFVAVVPTDEWYDTEFIAQTLGRGSGDFGYEYDEWSFFVPTPGFLDIPFLFEQDIQIYLETAFFAVMEGVSEDVVFILHSDITYGYVDRSFVLVNVTDNLVEQSLVQVSSWVRRPGRRPATL